MSTTEVLTSIAIERERQNRLVCEGKFNWTCATSRALPAEKLAVLAEEFGEVARHICEQVIDNARYNPRELKKELIQVAAVCVAWCEALDNEIDSL